MSLPQSGSARYGRRFTQETRQGDRSLQRPGVDISSGREGSPGPDHDGRGAARFHAEGKAAAGRPEALRPREPAGRVGAPIKTRAATLSIVSNSTLIVMKLVVGLMTGSISVLTEAIHSGVDLVAACIAFLAVRASEAPADPEHPYGHGKYENVSGAIEGLLILVAGGLVGWEAVRKLLHGEAPERIGLALGVMCGSAVLNYVVSHYLLKVGRQTGSDALLADAYHLRTDVYTSVGVLAGLSLYAWLRMPVLDPLAALVVTALILQMGWQTTRGSFDQLIDVALPSAETARIEALAREHPNIRGVHQLRTRRVGGQRQMDLHIQVPADLTVRQGHEIAHELKDRIEGEMGDIYATIHVEPWEEAGSAGAPGAGTDAGRDDPRTEP